jgi:hypothetical protein
VGETGHHRLGSLFALRGQGLDEFAHTLSQMVDRAAHPEPERRHGLLVAAATQVTLAREVSHDLAESRLHEAVHVLGVELEVRGVGLRTPKDLREALVECGRLRGRQGAATAEAACIGARRRDLLAQQPLVEGERGVELPEPSVRVARVVPAPELHER